MTDSFADLVLHFKTYVRRTRISISTKRIEISTVKNFTYLCCKASITDIALEGSLFSMTSIVNLQSRMARECFETNAAGSAASDAYKNQNQKRKRKRKEKTAIILVETCIPKKFV